MLINDPECKFEHDPAPETRLCCLQLRCFIEELFRCRHSSLERILFSDVVQLSTFTGPYAQAYETMNSISMQSRQIRVACVFFLRSVLVANNVSV